MLRGQLCSMYIQCPSNFCSRNIQWVFNVHLMCIQCLTDWLTDWLTKMLSLNMFLLFCYAFYYCTMFCNISMWIQYPKSWDAFASKKFYHWVLWYQYLYLFDKNAWDSDAVTNTIWHPGHGGEGAHTTMYSHNQIIVHKIIVKQYKVL